MALTYPSLGALVTDPALMEHDTDEIRTAFVTQMLRDKGYEDPEKLADRYLSAASERITELIDKSTKGLNRDAQTVIKAETLMQYMRDMNEKAKHEHGLTDEEQQEADEILGKEFWQENQNLIERAEQEVESIREDYRIKLRKLVTAVWLTVQAFLAGATGEFFDPSKIVGEQPGGTTQDWDKDDRDGT